MYINHNGSTALLISEVVRRKQIDFRNDRFMRTKARWWGRMAGVAVALFLIPFASCEAMYKCEQANGNYAYKDAPCAKSAQRLPLGAAQPVAGYKDTSQAVLVNLVPEIRAETDVPVASEQLVNNADIFLGNQLAPMLQMGDGSVLIFRNYRSQLLVIHLWPDAPQKQSSATIEGFKVPYRARAGHEETQYQADYASVISRAGIWLIGPTIELLSPNKVLQSGKLNKPRNNPKVVALPDGSILVAGSESWNAVLTGYDLNAPDSRTVERVSIGSDGRIVSEYVAPVPTCRPVNCLWEGLGSFAMVHIGQGRVMLVGGNDDGSYIYNDMTRSWNARKPMNEYRSRFPLTILSDGRVLAAGGDGYPRYKSNQGMTTEIWDPKTEKWSIGPQLPVPMIDHTSLLVNNETVILAGGQFAGVLAWNINYPQWYIASQLENARSRAGVFSLGNNRLAIIGGLHARNYKEAWGRRTEGYSLVSFSNNTVRHGTPTGLTARDHAVAVRGLKTFIAGGTLTSSFDGSVNVMAISNVELYDSGSNTVRSLPPLPFGAKSATASWLDDYRVLIKAVENDKANFPRRSILYDIKSGNQTIDYPDSGK